MRTSFSIPPPPAERARRARLPDGRTEREQRGPAPSGLRKQGAREACAMCAGADVLNFLGFLCLHLRVLVSHNLNSN